ncbi:mitochondrial 2-oxodicarboxylate carrier [Drosophila tropicalis]|uniref:mitochondrial 2-oxodicarboxylate carrier n=1 Tax=Drosophila tropicalis TaxID=46794 RepID=UPI0035AB7D23
MPIPDFTWAAAICQTAAGGSAGLLEVLFTHPLDVVKTRMQLQGTQAQHGEVLYRGFYDCFSKMYRYEGLSGFWKGIMPPIIFETPKRAFKFLLFEQFQRLFMFGKPERSAMTFALSGALAGTLECFFLNPFEVVKITQQANRYESVNTITVARQIIKKDGFGLRGLGKGITATMTRNAIFHFVFFGFYYGLKRQLSRRDVPLTEFLQRTSLAFLAGVLATLYSAPFDMAKSRIQGPQPKPGKIKYEWTLRTMQTVYREEGFRALFKGLSPSLVRIGPGGALILLAYEYGYDYCESKLI